MRYSQVNHWYKVEEALSGLDGTSRTEVQSELLKHVGGHHLTGFELDKQELTVSRKGNDPLRWVFRSPESAERFVATIREWFKSQNAELATDK